MILSSWNAPDDPLDADRRLNSFYMLPPEERSPARWADLNRRGTINDRVWPIATEICTFWNDTDDLYMPGTVLPAWRDGVGWRVADRGGSPESYSTDFVPLDSECKVSAALEDTVLTIEVLWDPPSGVGPDDLPWKSDNAVRLAWKSSLMGLHILFVPSEWLL